MSTTLDREVAVNAEAFSLHDDLLDRGVVDPKTGAPFTVAQLDAAITEARVGLAERHKTPLFLAGPFGMWEWWEALPLITDALGVEYDEVIEVAP